MNYKHLTQEEQYQIYAFKKAGVKPGKIAEVLERSGSTISRELSRNRGKRGYRPKQAQTLSEARWALNARRIDEATWTFAQERLLEQWSPEQISGHAAISPGTVYQRIYADKRAGGKKQPLVQLNGSNLCSQSRCLVTRAGRDSNSCPLGSQDEIQTLLLY